MYKVVTETGREVQRFNTEKAAEAFWEMNDGVYTEYNEKADEYYTVRIYIEEA